MVDIEAVKDGVHLVIRKDFINVDA